MIKTKCSLFSMIVFLTAAVAAPVFSQEVIQHEASDPNANLKFESAPSQPREVFVVNRGTADAMASVLSGRTWTRGNETATRPWSAPAGHHQPRAIDVLTSASSFEPFFAEEDARVDRIVRNICRGC